MQTNMARQHHFVMPDRRFLHPRALLAGLLMVPTYAYYVSVFYPGYYTADSLYMLQMGLGSAPISNWHPPLLSLLWGRNYTFFGGPHALWLVQLTLFFAAIGYLSSLYRNAVISVIAIVVLTWWPPLMTNMGAVWKDNWAIIAMIATVALTKAAWADRHRGLAMLALVMATVSATFRVDYIVVVFPLVLSLGWRFRGVPGAASFGAVALAMICGLLFAQSYFVTKRLNPWVAIAAWDIAGTIAQS